MTQLAGQHCVPCSASEPRVSEEEAHELHTAIPLWDFVASEGVPHLRRQYTFSDFATALEFTNRIGKIAEEEGHHPAILTEWGRVTVSWWTHVLGGLHRNDFIMAAKTDALAEGAPAS